MLTYYILKDILFRLGDRIIENDYINKKDNYNYAYNKYVVYDLNLNDKIYLAKKIYITDINKLADNNVDLILTSFPQIKLRIQPTNMVTLTDLNACYCIEILIDKNIKNDDLDLLLGTLRLYNIGDYNAK